MSYFASLVMYLSLFSLSSLMVFYGLKRNYKIFSFLGLLIPVAIAGLRTNVGTDYLGYIDIYNFIQRLGIAQFLSQNNYGIELGYYLIIKISSYLAGGTALMFTLSSALTIGFFYFGLKRYKLKHAALVYFLYLLTIFPFTLNGVRQGIAMSISFLAFSYLVERKPVQYIAWILAASLFHVSAIILLPFYFITRILRTESDRTSYRTLVKLLALAVLALTAIPTMLEFILSLSLFEKYVNYAGNTVMGNNYAFILKAMITALVLLVYSRVIKLDKQNIYFMAIAVLNLALSTLGFRSDVFNRITLYLSFYNLILLSNMVDVFEDRLGKFLSFAMVGLFGVLYFYLAFYILGQSNIFPYNFSLLGVGNG